MKISSAIKKRNVSKLNGNKVTSIKLNLIFNLPDFIDLNFLKERFKSYNLDNIEVFQKKELRGLISVPVKKIDIKGAVYEAKNQIAEPIKDAIVESGFASKIKEEVKENKATKSFIKWVQTIHKELKVNKITKDGVRKKTAERFSDLFGEKGIEIIVNLFSQDKDHILDSWAKLEDYLLQKLSLEFYIFQQIREACFVIVIIRSNDEEVKSLMMNSERILIPITEDVEFFRREIPTPDGKSIRNIFTHDKLQKVLMIFNPSKRTYLFMQRLLALRKTNSDLSFMTFMIEKQNKVVKDGLHDLEFDTEYIKGQVIDLDPRNLAYTIKSLKYLIDMIYYTREEYIKPCKKVSGNLLKKRKLISTKEYKRHFQQVITVDNIKGLIKPQEWMLTLLPEYNIEKTDKLLEESEELYLNILKISGGLRNQLIEYKKTKEQENKEKLIIVGKAIFASLKLLRKIVFKV